MAIIPDREIEHSPLGGRFTRDGCTVTVHIYRFAGTDDEWNARIADHNAAAAVGGGPLVEIAPLPAGAQFLNVIEAVFSGMARAIIHHSDYADVDAAKAAIDRYLADRNAAFLRHPRRAGQKIWGKEPAPAAFSDASNCKDPWFR